jgi:hypothetical protein
MLHVRYSASVEEAQIAYYETGMVINARSLLLATCLAVAGL